MPLHGTLETMPLPDLLQWLGTARLTGTLQVERNRVRKWILLKDGLVVGCSTDDPPERLGQFLMSRGMITEDQLRIALTVQEGSPKHLGKIFVEMGALTHENLMAHLEAKAEETIYSLFDWEDATFRFDEDLSDLQHILPLSLRVEDILLRGLKRYDELQVIRGVFNDPGIVLRRSDKSPNEKMLENKIARAIYESIDGERSVAEILLHVHGSEYLVTKFLYDLHRNGFATIDHVKQLPANAGQAADVTATIDDAGSASEPPTTVDAPQAPTAAAGAAPAASTAAALTGGEAGAAPSPETGASTATVEPETAPKMAVSPVPDWDPAPEMASDEIDRPADCPDEMDESTAPAAAAPPTSKAVEAYEESGPFQLDRQLQLAQGLMTNGDYEEALDILDKAYSMRPDDESLRRMTLEAEATFLEKAYRHYVPGNKHPYLVKPLEELETEKLSPTEFFLLSRIDGTWDVKSIIQVAPLREVAAVRTLKRMREEGMIELRDPEDES